MAEAKRIVSDRHTIGGAWRFEGTRIPVDIIAQQIDGVSVMAEDIPYYYPSLTVADAHAAVAWVQPLRFDTDDLRPVDELDRATAEAAAQRWDD